MQNVPGNVCLVATLDRYLSLEKKYRIHSHFFNRFLESSLLLLLMMISFYLIVCHWFACFWWVVQMQIQMHIQIQICIQM